MAATSLDELASDYFSSLSSLSFKLQQDCDAVKALYADTWNDLSWEKQEQLLDEHLIDQSILEKYADVTPSGERQVDCFPVLKINSGEKIVVDFEHEDGWTWTDEHSAPFSWRSKSQQDLSLADLDDVSAIKDDAVKKNRVVGVARPRSPDRIVSGHGLSLGDKNEVEMMFEKFGIKAKDLSASSDSPDPGQGELSPQSALSPSHLYNETSKLLAEFGDGKKTGPAAAAENPPLPLNKRKKSTSRAPDANQIANSDSMAVEYHDTEKGKDRRKTEKVKAAPSERKIKNDDAGKSKVTPKQKKEGHEKQEEGYSVRATDLVVDESTINFKRLSSGSNASASNDPALNVKLYIQEQGETSTDDILTYPVTSNTADGRGGGNWSNEPNLIITSQPTRASITSDSMSTTNLISQDLTNTGATVKTGFDFLDDW